MSLGVVTLIHWLIIHDLKTQQIRIDLYENDKLSIHKQASKTKIELHRLKGGICFYHLINFSP